MKRTKYIFILLLLMCLSGIKLYAQFKPDVEMTPDEKDLFENSLDAFKEDNFINSFQGFSQLLSLYPREPVFNFLYGASMIKMNTDIKKAFEYLEFAAGKGIGEANFYIGLGYHFLYDFNNAILFYNKFKLSVKDKYWDDYHIDKHIERANNGKNLIRYAYQLQVISNKQIGRKNFYYSYDLDNFGGEIIVKPEQFKGKADKKIDATDLMYISNIQNVVFLSSYGDSRKNSLDIYISHKTNTGWSDPKKLPDIINTPYDEAFPFLSEDGSTLYFSSKGHNSIGGYDIFKSTYNSQKNTWSKPVNLDFPINTPFDEIMYASDRYDETAFFASTRESGSEQIGVYRILLDKNPLSREVKDINDIYSSASLNIDPTAMTELTKRQEVRANSMIDTTDIRENITAHNDSANNTDQLISNSIKLLDEKSSEAEEYLEYAAAAYKICKIEIEEVEGLNKKVNSLKNKTDDKSVKLRDSLSNLIIEKSLLLSEMYDISKYFYDKGSQINSLTDYYSNEIGLLSDIDNNDVLLAEEANKLYNEIQKISTDEPVDKYIEKINQDIGNKGVKLTSYQDQLDSKLEKLEELNEKIEIKLDLAKKEEDFEVREKYVYDIKTYENSKIDLISEIKEIEVQIEFLNYEIEQLNKRKDIVLSYDTKLENSLVSNPDLNISKLNNEVEIIKTHVSQNSLRELSYKQDVILADKSLYSKEMDLDAILYAGPDLTNMGLDEVMIDTKSYTDKYQEILSVNTLKTGDLIFKNDSLKDEIAYLETEFDNAATSVEQQEIINEINRLTSEINNNNAQITEYLDSQAKVNVDIYMSEFESLKNSPAIGPTNPDLIATSELIEESQNLQKDIEDLIVIGADEDNPPILYLEGMKSEIDNLIVENIEQLKAAQLLAESNLSDTEIYENVETELRNVKPDFDPDKLKEITEGFEEVEKIYKNANKEKDPVIKNDLLNEANNKLDITVNKNIDFLNDQLVREYAVYNLFDENYANLNEKPEYNQEYLDKINALKSDAANLQMQAEETSDDLAKMQNLAKAWENLKLANEYYNYVFNITQDEREYKPDYEIKPEKSTTEFIAASTEIVRIEPVEIENTDIALNNDTISVDTISNNTDIAINNDTIPIDSLQNNSDIALNNNDIIPVDTISNNSDISLNNNDTIPVDSSSNADIAVNNNDVNPVDTISNNNDIAVSNTNNPEDSDINKTIDKLNEVDYQGKIAINISSQAKTKEEVDNYSNEINKLKIDIENTNSNNKAEKLRSELRKKEEQQIDAIIEYSITTNEILAELDSISKFSNQYNSTLLDSLIAKQFELRNSIVNYSNFYTADEILDKHIEATTVENDLMALYNNMIQSTDDEILAENLNKAPTNVNTNISTNDTNLSENNLPDFNTAGNYEFEYPYDDKEESDLVKLENRINTLESDIAEMENLMSGIESQMNSLNDLNEYKKLQKQLQKENKKYLKQVKLWAELNKEYISMQYEMGDTHYFNIQSTNSDISEVSDSLKYVSDDQLNESLALFEVIITYSAKQADEAFIESYQKASGLAVQGINTMNAANSLKSQGDENDPLMIAHYRSVETNDVVDVIETDTSSNAVSDTSHLANNDFINNSLPNDTIPAADTALLANNTNTDNPDSNNPDEHNGNDTNTENNNNQDANENRSFDTSNMFDPNADSFYSDANPITGIPYIEGLVYRIQIAAFNGKTANDRFRGLKPLFWEEIPNSNLVRYITGNFSRYDDAAYNLPTARTMGYPDAFIVAYYNGERIPIYEARRIEEREDQNIIAANNNDTNVDNDNNINNVNNNNDTENNINNNTDVNAITLTDSDITKSSGVFFCVQIGVYASEIGSDRLFGLDPLMYHNYTGNLVRHLFGRYFDINTAINEQNKIRRLGIPDAFVVAYKDGEKISLNEARELLANAQPTDAKILVNIPENQIPDNPPVADNNVPDNNNDNIEPADNNNNIEETPPPTIEYYIQIGVFRNDVNTYVRESFRRIAGENQLVRLTSNNMTLYRIGVFSSYQDAQNSLGGVINSGIKDAFVVAFVNGKRVNANQAQALE